MAFSFRKLPRGIRHSFWGVLDAALYPLIYLATISIIKKDMGQTVFGVWIVLNSLIIILQLFNFNLGVTALRNVSYELARDNKTNARDLMNGILHISLLLMLLVSLLGWGLSDIAVNNGWWGLQNAQQPQLSLCVLLSAVFAGLKYFDQAFQGIIKAHENFKMAAILNMANRFGQMFIILYMAIKQYYIADILAANIVFLLIYLLVQLLCICYIMPFYRPGLLVDRKHYRHLLNFSLWPWLQSLIIVLTFQSDRFWVSSFSGLGVVSDYGLVSTIFNHIHIIFTAMAAWMLPRIAAMHARGDDPAILYNRVRAGLLGLVIISLLFFYFISAPLFTLWVGADTYLHMQVYIRVFIAFELVFAHTIMPFLYLNAAGKERLATLATLLYCGTCYALMLAGLWYYHSPVALVEGMTLSMCITMPFINMIVQQNLHKSYAWEHALLEMLPMYAAITLLYSNTLWLGLLMAALLLWTLWKFYLSNVLTKSIWKQVANT